MSCGACTDLSPVYPALHTHCPVDGAQLPPLWHWHSCEQFLPKRPAGHGCPHTAPWKQHRHITVNTVSPLMQRQTMCNNQFKTNSGTSRWSNTMNHEYLSLYIYLYFLFSVNIQNCGPHGRAVTPRHTIQPAGQEHSPVTWWHTPPFWQGQRSSHCRPCFPGGHKSSQLHTDTKHILSNIFQFMYSMGI